LRGVVADRVHSCRDDPRLLDVPCSMPYLVALARPVVTRGDHASIPVRVCAVVLCRIHVRAQYVVGALGLPSEGCCRGAGIGTAGTAAADRSSGRAIPAAGRSSLVLPPCGLGLIPINSNVQIFVLPRIGDKRKMGVSDCTHFAILG